MHGHGEAIQAFLLSTVREMVDEMALCSFYPGLAQRKLIVWWRRGSMTLFKAALTFREKVIMGRGTRSDRHTMTISTRWCYSMTIPIQRRTCVSRNMLCSALLDAVSFSVESSN